MKSMTGYGKATIAMANKNINVEIKTLNSKQADIIIKCPHTYRCIEIEVYNLLKQRLVRGKIDCYITISQSNTQAHLDLNEDLFRAYYQQLGGLFDSVVADKKNLGCYLLNREDVMQNDTQETSPEELQAIINAVSEACDEVERFRLQEGEALEKDFQKRVQLIDDLSLQVEPFEKQRIEQIKEKLSLRLQELELDSIDNARFEQELIYYLEKLDITEERIRLAQHVKYFLETMEKEEVQGKKLGFIAQEMGREINTLGSKSNDADMQKIVVMMKDELEKIKEQVCNVL